MSEPEGRGGAKSGKETNPDVRKMFLSGILAELRKNEFKECQDAWF